MPPPERGAGGVIRERSKIILPGDLVPPAQAGGIKGGETNKNQREEPMETLEKAKHALHRATIARLNEIEGLVKVALETEDEVEFAYCIAQIKVNAEQASENAISLYVQELSNVTPELVQETKKRVDARAYEIGYGLGNVEDIIKQVHREYVGQD